MKYGSLLMLFWSTFLSCPSEARAFNIERRVEVSREVFLERMESRFSIPREVLAQAQCIASIRSVKAGFIFGGEGSTGLVSCRTPETGNNYEWSTPSFLNVGGVDYGLLIGGQVVDTVLVFMTPFSRQLLYRAQLQVGGDLEVVAGPVGAGGGVIPVAPVLSYSKGRGLFAGISVKAVVLAHGVQRNREVYGNRTPQQILDYPASLGPEVVLPYANALAGYSN